MDNSQKAYSKWGDVMIDFITATDTRPKNNTTFIDDNSEEPSVEWYSPRKHKHKLIAAMLYCLYTGYEMDLYSFYNNQFKLHYKVCLRGVTLHISCENYARVSNEAVKIYDQIREWFHW